MTYAAIHVFAVICMVVNSSAFFDNSVLEGINDIQNEATNNPSKTASSVPTALPSIQPTSHPSSFPSLNPTNKPSLVPTDVPSLRPSLSPSLYPSSTPTSYPSIFPTQIPSGYPSSQPSLLPSNSPSQQPTDIPSLEPSRKPSEFPSSKPSQKPSVFPSLKPSQQPSESPSRIPSQIPSTQPSRYPSPYPSKYPTQVPSQTPSQTPTVFSSSEPSYQPSISFERIKNQSTNGEAQNTQSSTKKSLIDGKIVIFGSVGVVAVILATVSFLFVKRRHPQPSFFRGDCDQYDPKDFTEDIQGESASPDDDVGDDEEERSHFDPSTIPTEKTSIWRRRMQNLLIEEEMDVAASQANPQSVFNASTIRSDGSWMHRTELPLKTKQSSVMDIDFFEDKPIPDHIMCVEND